MSLGALAMYVIIGPLCLRNARCQLHLSGRPRSSRDSRIGPGSPVQVYFVPSRDGPVDRGGSGTGIAICRVTIALQATTCLGVSEITREDESNRYELNQGEVSDWTWGKFGQSS